MNTKNYAKCKSEFNLQKIKSKKIKSKKNKIQKINQK